VRAREGEISQVFDVLRNSGRFKEFFVMKRKDNAEAMQSQLSFFHSKITPQGFIYVLFSPLIG